METPVALTIAGSDSGAGAGIQADLRTFTACGAFGVTAITCLTAQNPDSVTDVMPVTPEFLLEQIHQLDRFFPLRAAKTGMLFSADLIRATATFFRERPEIPLVIDPVMVATSGAVLLQDEAIQTLANDLLPLAAVITPNLDEAGVLLGQTPANLDEMAAAARDLAKRFSRPVLLKGGHLTGQILTDILASPDGREWRFQDERIENVDTHGSGCTLSAAIAAHLARGSNLPEAVAAARQYLRHGMIHAIRLNGRRFINHNL